MAGKLAERVGHAAGGQQQLVVAQGGGVEKLQLLAGAVEARDAGIGAQLDVMLGVEIGLAQGQAVGVRLAGEVGLAELGAVVGRRRVGRHQHHAASEAFLAQRLGRELPGCAAAHYHVGVAIIGFGWGLGGGGAAYFGGGRFIGLIGLGGRVSGQLHVHPPVGHAHRVAGQGIEGGRLAEAAVLHPEAGVVPGAHELVAHQAAFFQRGPVVRALRGQGVILVLATHQQHFRAVGGSREGAQLALLQGVGGGKVDFGWHGE